MPINSKQSLKIPGQSLAYFGLWAVGILAFVLLGIYPERKNIAELDKEIQKTRAEIEEQKVLCPLSKTLTEKCKAVEKFASFPARTDLSREQMDKVPAVFATMAHESGLEVVSVVPDVKSLSKNSNLMTVNAVFTGDFFNFRKLLIALEQLPYVERMAELLIQPGDAGKDFSLKVLVRIGTVAGG